MCCSLACGEARYAYNKSASSSCYNVRERTGAGRASKASKRESFMEVTEEKSNIVFIGMNLRELYDERKPLYEQYAEITVNVDDLPIMTAARKVADALR